jgi:hypothetical protein
MEKFISWGGGMVSNLDVRGANISSLEENEIKFWG